MTDQPHIVAENGHRFVENVCVECLMPHYLFLACRQPSCGSVHADIVMKRYADAMRKQSA